MSLSTSIISSEKQEVFDSIHAEFSLDNYDAGREKAREANLKKCGEGTGRVVYELPSDFTSEDIVVKISKNMKGVQANQTEAFTFEKAPQWLRERLAPVVGSDSWVLSRKCLPGDEEAVEEIEFFFLNQGVYCADIEIRKDNIGYLNGKAVLFDYGFKLSW